VFLDNARRWAEHGTCLRRNFGAIIVDEQRHTVTTGLSGAPSKEKDCLELGTCWREERKIPSGSNYEKCRSVHAEQNALIQAGERARGCTLYLCGVVRVGTGFEVVFRWPCFMCTKLMVNAGIDKVIIRASAATPSAIKDVQGCTLYFANDPTTVLSSAAYTCRRLDDDLRCVSISARSLYQFREQEIFGDAKGVVNGDH
jgi:dCMP deaminase